MHVLEYCIKKNAEWKHQRMRINSKNVHKKLVRSTELDFFFIW